MLTLSCPGFQIGVKLIVATISGLKLLIPLSVTVTNSLFSILVCAILVLSLENLSALDGPTYPPSLCGILMIDLVGILKMLLRIVVSAYEPPGADTVPAPENVEPGVLRTLGVVLPPPLAVVATLPPGNEVSLSLAIISPMYLLRFLCRKYSHSILE